MLCYHIPQVWLIDVGWASGNYGNVASILVAPSEDWHPELAIENRYNSVQTL